MEVRGKGLLLGLEFVNTEFGYEVVAGLFKRGVARGRHADEREDVRIEPALNIPRPLVDEVLEKFEETLKELTD